MVMLFVGLASGIALRNSHARQQLLQEKAAFAQMRIELRDAVGSCYFLPPSRASSRAAFRRASHLPAKPLAGSVAQSWQLRTWRSADGRVQGRIEASYGEWHEGLARRLAANFAGSGWPVKRVDNQVRVFLAPGDEARFSYPGRYFFEQYPNAPC